MLNDNKLKIMDNAITELKKKNKMICPKCGNKVKVENFTFKMSDSAALPFEIQFKCLSCNAEYEIEGQTEKGEVTVWETREKTYF